MPRDPQARDERKSGHMGVVQDAYGNATGSVNNPSTARPFDQPGSPFAGSGGGVGMPGLYSSPAPITSQNISNTIATSAGAPSTAVAGPLSAADSLRRMVTTPQGILGLTSLLPLLSGLGGGGNGPFSGADQAALMEEIRKALALQRQRVEQAQPVYDSLVNRALAYAPNPSYGGAAYSYRGPQFGG